MRLLPRRLVLALPLLVGFSLAATACERPYYRSISHVKRDKKRTIARQLSSVRLAASEARDQLLLSRDHVRVLLSEESPSKATIDAASLEVHRCETRRRVLDTRIISANTNAEGVFLDWDRERSEISDGDLAEASRIDRRATREGFDRCIDAAKSALDSMNPALELLNDQATLLRQAESRAASRAAKETLASLDSRVHDAAKKFEAALKTFDEFVPTLDAPGTSADDQ